MNVNDMDDKAVAEVLSELDAEDMLAAIFKRQHELMEKYEPIEKANGLLQTDKVPVDIQSAAGQARLKDFAWRTTEEIGEAMNTLKNKPWKQTHMLTDETHYLEEIADALHFFIELCILSGFTPETLFLMYFKKSEVNKFRQESKY